MPDITQFQNDNFLRYPLLSFRQLLNHSVALPGRTEKKQAVVPDTVSKAKKTWLFPALFKTKMPTKKGDDGIGNVRYVFLIDVSCMIFKLPCYQ